MSQMRCYIHGDAAKIYEKRKLERKIAEKEIEKDWLRRKLTRKEKKFDFGPLDPKFMKVEPGPVKQQMKTTLMVEGMPELGHIEDKDSTIQSC